MTVTVANTANTDYVYVGRTRQNEIAHALTTKVVTVDSNAATGNAHVNGAIQAGALHVNVISGGVVGTPNTLTVNTTVTFTGTRTNLGAGANVMVTTGNSTHRVLTVNASNSFSLVGTKITIAGDVSDANVTSPANNQVLVFSNAESTWKNQDATVLTVGNAANAVYAANADKLDGLDATAFASNTHTHAYADLTSKPTTAQGFGLSEINLGNSTVNSVSTNTSVTVSNTVANASVVANRIATSNSTGNAAITPAGLAVGNATTTIAVVNASVVAVGNVTANTTALSIGNSTVNAVVTASAVTIANSTASIALTKPSAAQVSAGNYFLGANGTWQQVGGTAPTVQVFTANGTYTPPAGLKGIKVIVVGGGGGCVSGAGGGSGGGGAIKWIAAPLVSSPVTVTVGLAGPSTSPGAGGNSAFGTLVTASGGSGSAGAGGGGANGDINFTGGSGEQNVTSGPAAGLNIAVSGAGGSSILGTGGAGKVGAATGTGPEPQWASSIGQPATGYGGGAGGRTSGSPIPTATAGIVIVEEFY